MSSSTDRQIDLALQALGSAAPREGMDQRLLARLENRTTASATSWRPVLTFAPPAAGLLTAALLLLIFHHTKSPTAPAITQTTAQAAPGVNQVSPQRVQPLAVSSTFHASAPISSASVAGNSADIDPAYLPSFPAPAAPLTADERRLIRLAQHAATFDVAQLEAPPEALARQRQDAVGEYIRHMLAPLVTAESFSPTPAVEQDPPAPQPEPDSNSSPQ